MCDPLVYFHLSLIHHLVLSISLFVTSYHWSQHARYYLSLILCISSYLISLTISNDECVLIWPYTATMYASGLVWWALHSSLNWLTINFLSFCSSFYLCHITNRPSKYLVKYSHQMHCFTDPCCFFACMWGMSRELWWSGPCHSIFLYMLASNCLSSECTFRWMSLN